MVCLMRPAKAEFVRDRQGRMHIAQGLGKATIATRLRIVSPFVSTLQLLRASQSEPAKLLHETEEDYITRLYQEVL